MRLAKVENAIVTSIIIGDAAKFPNLIDVTNIRCGIGWTDNLDGTFSDSQTYEDVRLVALMSLEDELPDSVLIELNDIITDDTMATAKRAATLRIVNRINRNDKIGVKTFSKLLDRLVARTSLTRPQANAISKALGV